MSDHEITKREPPFRWRLRQPEIFARPDFEPTPDVAGDGLHDSLLVVLDMVDYTSGACGPAEPVAGVLPTQVIVNARAAIERWRKRGEPK
jgi:hypothetical protein